jgi:hypothetical protein
MLIVAIGRLAVNFHQQNLVQSISDIMRLLHSQRWRSSTAQAKRSPLQAKMEGSSRI